MRTERAALRHRARPAAGRSARTLRRFLGADGTSHARALAYEIMFVTLSGFVGLVGLSSLLDAERVRNAVLELGRSISPGPAGQLLEDAARRGAQSGATAAFIGLGAALLSGTLAMAQVERSANRLSGSDRDRPFLRRYVVAFLLAATLGVVLAAGALVMGGGAILSALGGGSQELSEAWTVARWPIGIAIVGAAVILLFRFAPADRGHPWRSVLVGAAVTVALWAAFTGLLSLYFSIRSGSSPYGHLLSIIALLLWAMLTSLSVHLGLAAMCELSDAPTPKDGTVVRVDDLADATRA